MSTVITLPSQSLKVSNKPNKYGERAVRLGDEKIGYIKPHRVPATGTRSGAEWAEYWSKNEPFYSGFDWCYGNGHRRNDQLYPSQTKEAAALCVYAAWLDSNQ